MSQTDTRHSINRNIVECKDSLPYAVRRDKEGINRNIVECKEFSFCGSFDCSDGINRNIVECKEQDAYNSRQDHTSINRNIVECKEGRDIRGLTIEIVLIETSWNVKPEVFPSTVQNRSPY